MKRLYVLQHPETKEYFQFMSWDTDSLVPVVRQCFFNPNPNVCPRLTAKEAATLTIAYSRVTETALEPVDIMSL